MFGISDRAYRRAERVAALVYPFGLLAVLVLALGVPSGQPLGGEFFVLSAVGYGLIPAAFATGLLVLLVNGL